MMNRLKKYIKNMFAVVPEWLWFPIERGLAYCGRTEVREQLKVRRFARRLLLHFDETIAEVLEKRKCMVISQGSYGYTCFNIAYLSNMLALILHALYHGCIPIIKINEESENDNKWGWYFLQPYEVMGVDVSGFEMTECDIVNCEFRPQMHQIHLHKEFEFNFWKFMFKKFVVLNIQTQQYVKKEMDELGKPDRFLGVLLRGTDYIRLKPAGHPVQPTPEEIIGEAKNRFEKKQFDGIYVATEERFLFDQVVSVFGENIVFQNKREYYDAQYYSSELGEIGQVHFSRDNDNFLKGLEYLSSLMILSQCKSLVAGNCGGTLFAMLMGDYSEPYVFDYGVY